MFLTQWRRPWRDGWSELHRLHREMNRLFDREPNGGAWPILASAFPAVNIWQDADSVVVETELPGMELNDLEILVTGGNQLTLKGERKQPVVDANCTWHRQERGFGQFTRVITLPFDVDSDKVVAEFVNGVLTIKLPRAERAKPRKIEVTSN